MSNFYRYANLEAEHFFCVEEASADCQQAILLVNYENFFCGAKFRIDLLNVFAEHVTSLLDELLDPRDDLDPESRWFEDTSEGLSSRGR